MADERPILVFDSGVGGLSVLAEIRKLLPQANYAYAADNAGYPYGTKSEAELTARIPAILGRLVERVKPRIVVIACNTASTIALAHVRSALDVPVVGTVPAVKPAALQSKTRVIGVLGTEATVRQPYVDQLVQDHGADCTVLRLGSATLVDMAEAKLRGNAPDPDVIKAEMDKLFRQPQGDKIDAVILSCTHFPLLSEEISAAIPHSAMLVDSGQGIARRTAYLTQGQQWPATPSGRAIFTRDDPDLECLRPALQRLGLNSIEIL